MLTIKLVCVSYINEFVTLLTENVPRIIYNLLSSHIFNYLFYYVCIQASYYLLVHVCTNFLKIIFFFHYFNLLFDTHFLKFLSNYIIVCMFSYKIK